MMTVGIKGKTVAAGGENLPAASRSARVKLTMRGDKLKGPMGWLVCAWLALPPLATATAAAQTQPEAQAKRAPKASPYHPNRLAGRAGDYYRLVWGVDDLGVKWGESGEVIRFTYRVLDADKAKMLNEVRNEPSLIDPQAGVKLVVPSMENVGQLRQSSPPENGKSYWMVFSNKGRLVKRGHHINIVIGQFQANGLVVD